MFASIFEINTFSVNDFSHPKRIIGTALMARFEILLFVRIHVPHYTKNFHAALFRKVKEKWMDAAQNMTSAIKAVHMIHVLLYIVQLICCLCVRKRHSFKLGFAKNHPFHLSFQIYRSPFLS